MDDLEKSVNKRLVAMSAAENKTVRCIEIEGGNLIVSFNDGTFCFFESRNGDDGCDSSIDEMDYIDVCYSTQDILIRAGIVTSQQYQEDIDKRSYVFRKSMEEVTERAEKADYLRLKAKYEPVVADTAST